MRVVPPEPLKLGLAASAGRALPSYSPTLPGHRHVAARTFLVDVRVGRSVALRLSTTRIGDQVVQSRARWQIARRGRPSTALRLTGACARGRRDSARKSRRSSCWSAPLALGGRRRRRQHAAPAMQRSRRTLAYRLINHLDHSLRTMRPRRNLRVSGFTTRIVSPMRPPSAATKLALYFHGAGSRRRPSHGRQARSPRRMATNPAAPSRRANRPQRARARHLIDRRHADAGRADAAHPDTPRHPHAASRWPRPTALLASPRASRRPRASR